MSREYWLPIPGADGYIVSNYGRVGSIYRRKRGGLIEVRNPILILATCMRGDYMATSVIYSGKRRKVNIHTLVADAFLPPVAGSNVVVAHENGNPLDNRVSNLKRKTQKENMADKNRHGTAQIGARNPSWKYPLAMVQEIRRRRSHGERPCDIAKALGLPYPYVWKISSYSNERAIA